jgi:hypothetical protein
MAAGDRRRRGRSHDRSHDRLPPWVRALGLLAGTLAALWWLLRLGDGALPGPPLRHPTDWTAWVDRVGPVTATFGVLRLACTVAVLYLTACLGLALLAGITRRRDVARASRWLCLPALRPLIERAIGATLGVAAMTALAAPVNAGAAPVRIDSAPVAASPSLRSGAGAPPTMRAVVRDPRNHTAAAPGTPTMTLRARSERPEMTMRAGPGDPTLTMRPRAEPTPTMTLRASSDRSTEATKDTMADPAGGRGSTPMPLPGSAHGEALPDQTVSDVSVNDAPSAPAHPDPPSRADAGDARPGPVAEGTYVVQPGDHFWSIAERSLGVKLGRPVEETEVAAYWERLIEANSDRLADPANADLLFAGQALRLPEAR